MLTPDARIETTKYYRQGGQTSNVDDSSRTRFAGSMLLQPLKSRSPTNQTKTTRNKSTKTGHFAQKKTLPRFTPRNLPTASNNRSTPQNVLIIRALSKDHPTTTLFWKYWSIVTNPLKFQEISRCPHEQTSKCTKNKCIQYYLLHLSSSILGNQAKDLVFCPKKPLQWISGRVTCCKQLEL